MSQLVYVMLGWHQAMVMAVQKLPLPYILHDQNHHNGYTGNGLQ